MKLRKTIVGRAAELHVSDPWEFESENVSPKVVGVVEVANDRALLLHAQVGVTIGGEVYDRFVCEMRHEGATIADAFEIDGVACSGTAIPERRLSEAKELDVTWWRGGGAVIGNLKIV